MSKTNQLKWNPPSIRETWMWDEDQIRKWQLEQFNAQMATILPANGFYREKLGTESLQLNHLDELASLPFTTKQDLVASADAQPDGISRHHTFSPEYYSRMHRTSGTTGHPLMVLDTESDWQRWSWTWQHVLEAAELESRDRVFLAFSFGPFIGFWSAHQACIDRGMTVIPGGGLSSLARLEFMKQSATTAVCCTPSYALHLGEVAAQENFDLHQLNIRRIIVAGESGGSVPAVRKQIEDTWDAQVIDHSGATEVGPWGFGWPDRCGLHIAETSFIAEFLPIENAEDDSGQLSELVLTSLGRLGAPVIRYRTGDAVLASRPDSGPCRFLWLPNGVVGRTDDMLPIRGVNVFPSSIDAVVRQFSDIAEYQVKITRDGSMDQMQVIVESNSSTCEQLTKRLSVQLGLRIPVSQAEPGSLPRSELKSRRWLDLR